MNRFLSASLVVAADHFLRGIYWPRSVYGALTVSPWRWVEHSAWVVFEDIVLVRACRQSCEKLRELPQSGHDLVLSYLGFPDVGSFSGNLTSRKCRRVQIVGRCG